ncbi:MAG: hypothetical protein M3N52_06995, partial [Actinomycetota bacterium]|nr:hypothetical protein [Actinomycetota bacterium]
LAALVAGAGRVVCGDTGVGHLATALRTPSVLLFGPTSPARWGPPPDRPWHRALWAGSDGRASHPHPHAPHPSRHPPAPPSPHAARPDARLLQVSVADVIEALALLPAPLRSGGSPTRQR